MDKYLKCNGILKLCPICDSIITEWPQAGTHAFTIIYECGTEIDYPISGPGASYGSSCNGEIKKFVMPKVSKETLERMREGGFFNDKRWRR